MNRIKIDLHNNICKWREQNIMLLENDVTPSVKRSFARQKKKQKSFAIVFYLQSSESIGSNLTMP